MKTLQGVNQFRADNGLNWKVEVREGKQRLFSDVTGYTPHLMPDSDEWKESYRDACKLGAVAMNDGNFHNVIPVLQKYANRKHLKEIEHINIHLSKIGFYSWQDLVLFVKNDFPDELFVRIIKYMKSRGVDFTQEGRKLDFLEFVKDVRARYTYRFDKYMELVFDEKYFRNAPRINHVLAANGLFVEDEFLYVFDEHPEDPAGHGTNAGLTFDASESLVENEDTWSDFEPFVWVCCFAMAQARCHVAHLPTSNNNGLIIGCPTFFE